MGGGNLGRTEIGPGNPSRISPTIPAPPRTPPAGRRVGLCCTPTPSFHPNSKRPGQAPPCPRPQNLGPPFRSWDGTCSLSIQFGLRVPGALKRPGEKAGTLDYAPPSTVHTGGFGVPRAGDSQPVYVPDTRRADNESGPPGAQLLRSEAAKFAARNRNSSNFLRVWKPISRPPRCVGERAADPSPEPRKLQNIQRPVGSRSVRSSRVNAQLATQSKDANEFLTHTPRRSAAGSVRVSS